MNRFRFDVAAFLLLIPGLVVLGRAAQITVLRHDELTDYARSQQSRVMLTHGPRGKIVSSDGYQLASSVRRYAVQVDRDTLQFPKLFSALAATILEEPQDEIRRRLEAGGRYTWLTKNLDLEKAESIEALDEAAVWLVPHWARQYPLGRHAAPLIGFVGMDDLQLRGRSGLESYYESLLVGETNRYHFVEDAHRRLLRLESVDAGRGGFNLELTLSARLQVFAESELEAAIEASGATAGSVVVMECHTGNLLSLASAPFSPRPSARFPYRAIDWMLRPVQVAIEPGSTVKPIIAASALSAGVVTDDEVFDCRDRGIHVAGHWIRDHAVPDLYTIDGVVAESSNTGIIRIAERIDPGLLWRAFDAFGFGRTPELGFAGESAGILHSPDRWTGMSTAGHALGQELTVSPLQLAMAYAAIANGGWLPEPRLVDRVDGRSKAPSDRVALRTRVLDERLSARLISMLERVVDEGTGELARVPGYRVGGKTGTAQTVAEGVFDDDHHTAWFAGFLPLPNPRWVVVVTIENPTDDYWASSIAAPVFSTVAERTAHLFGATPTAPPSPGSSV